MLRPRHTRPHAALRFRNLLAAAASTVLGFGCGGKEEPPKTPDVVEPPPEAPHATDVSTLAEIGALDQEEVAKGFREAQRGIQACLIDGAKRVEFLGGDIAFFIKIDQQQKLAHVHAEHSSLGDRATEKCMFDALRNSTWPAPEGGLMGIAHSSFDFDMPNDVRPPVMWDSRRVKPQKSALHDQILECKHGSKGKFEATLYVDTEGSPISASVTPPDEAGESSVDCLVSLLLKAHYDSPGSWPVKVTFPL